MHTFSIVARDARTGEMGVAIQSHWFAVGALCPWAEAGTGAIATQSMVEVSYGPMGLQSLRNGKSAMETLNFLIGKDKQQALRQVAIVDAKGNIAVHTGKRCIAEAGHIIGNGFSVQANMMINKDVLPAMSTAYQKREGNLANKMLAALKAGQSAGGDIRGKQSACMIIVGGERSNEPWNFVRINLRVHDHSEPIKELERLLLLQSAYNAMNEGDTLLAKNQTQKAMKKYSSAAKLAPEIEELPFWQAVTLAENGQIDEALPIFKWIFKRNPNWGILIQRLPASGLLKINKDILDRILALIPKKE